MGEAEPRGRFPASQRVRKRTEFQEIQSRGRRVVTPHFVFLIHACAGRRMGSAARLGITASRKVGSATVRNRAKRLVREAFRSTRAMWKPGIDVVVIVRRPLSGLGLDDVVSEWSGAAPRVAKNCREVLHVASGAQQ